MEQTVQTDWIEKFSGCSYTIWAIPLLVSSALVSDAPYRSQSQVDGSTHRISIDFSRPPTLQGTKLY